MTPSIRFPRAAFGIAISCAFLTGQEMRLLDGIAIVSSTHDPVRGRVVAIGGHLETREFDGTRWQVAPQVLPGMAQDVRLVFDPASGRTLACRSPLGGPISVDAYDGISWRQLPATVPPPERHGYACAFDAQRGRLVMFGGLLGTYQPTDETWTFDGSSWSQHSSAVMPQPRIGAAMAFDAARGRTVLFGGDSTSPAETWEWDGSNWSRIVTATIPTGRRLPGMAYDAARGRVVLFGGVDLAFLDDLWEYDGTDWYPQSMPGGPSPRQGAQCVFDPVLGETRVFGGSHSGPMDDGMWSWNGTRWLQHTLPPHPGARGVLGSVSTSMADPLGRGLVLYNPEPSASTRTWRWDTAGWHPITGPSPSGRSECAATGSFPKSYLHGGSDSSLGTYLADLWSFDGTSWTLEATTGPSARVHHAIAYDMARGELVLFGGVTSVAMSAETWAFVGSAWTQRLPAVSPPARELPVMAYDLARNRTVLAGGHGSTGLPLTDTWEWDGTNWTQVTTAVSLPASYGRAAFDLQRGRVVMVHAGARDAEASDFDGVDWSDVPLQPSGWLGGPFQVNGFPYKSGLLIDDLESVRELSSTAAQVTHYGVACTAGAPDLGCNTWPRIGATNHGIDIVGAPPASFVLLLGAIQPANAPIAGCTQLVQPGQASMLLAITPSGCATAPMPLPNNDVFVGVELFFQAAALQPTAPGGFTLSRGLHLTIGD